MSNTKSDLSDDPVIESLTEALIPVIKKVEDSSNHGLLALGVAHCDHKNDESVRTFTVVIGDLGILAEGLYAELADMIDSGDASLFTFLRQVIRDLEEDYDISEKQENFKLEGTSSIH